jgi:4-hydroxy-L-threonine phosphate dehydrogenase PdxA
MVLKPRPLVAITLGDAAGIGPEVIAKAVSEKSVYSTCRPLVIGELATFQKALDLVKSPLKII